MDPSVSIQLNLVLFLRCFTALLWGFGLAVFLQRVKLGQFMAQERTYQAVIIGVGADLAISFGGDWFTVTAVIAFSSVGVIVRSVRNEARTPKQKNHDHHTLMVRIVETVIKRLEEVAIEIVNLSDSSGVNEKGTARIVHILKAIDDTEKMLIRARGDYK